MRNTPCECPSPGWCERHQCEKSEALFQLCRRNQKLFRDWEDGFGPGQSARNAESATSAETPGLIRRIANFGTAAARHVMSGFQRVSDEECNARLSICRACSSCDLAQMICREISCGCYLQTKARWASEDCPRGFWATSEAMTMVPVNGEIAARSNS